MKSTSISPQGLAGPGGPAVQEKPFLTIRPTAGWQAINLTQIWLYRDLLMTLAERDVKLRYRQTALGVVWVILQPLLAAGIFSFVFGKVAKLPSDGVPYIIFSYAGLLGWNAFNSTLGKVSTALTGNSALISKVYFPRLILPLSTILSTLIDFGVAFAMYIVLMYLYHVTPGWAILLLPFWLFLILLFSVGVGLYAAALMVTYRDVQYVLPVATNFLLYASPVAYSLTYALSVIPKQYRIFYLINPLSGLLDGCRWSLLGRGDISWNSIIYSVVISVLVFVGGAFSFKKMERTFADVI